MAWQDSHFSLSYDRPSTTAVSQPDIAYLDGYRPGNLTYFETLSRIMSLALEVVRTRMLSAHTQMTFDNFQGYKERIQKVMNEAKPYLRESKWCKTSKDHLERAVLKLHSSYFSSELCRPALKLPANSSGPSTSSMREDCMANLMTTVEAYIEMHNISPVASRSWIALQRAISSAFLLAVVEESKSNPNVWELLRQLEGIIAKRASSEQTYNGSGVDDGAANVSSPTTYDPITGTTTTIDSSFTVGNAPEPSSQWAKSLAKTHRALQKLLTAFGNLPPRPSSGQNPAAYAPHLNQNSLHVHGGFAPPAASALTPSVSSLPPPTPESSGSGEWTIPNILDRASEYINPPLWD